MSSFLIQMIGWLGMLAFLISYQMKNNKSLFLCQVVGVSLFCLQFCLLGAFSGCLSLAITILRGALLYKYNDWKFVRWKGLPWILCGMFALVLIVTWAGPISLLAFVASVVSTLCYWTNNAGMIRLSNLLCASPCWIVYDVLVGSWGGVASESLTILSILISIFRFGWKSLIDKDSSFQK